MEFQDESDEDSITDSIEELNDEMTMNQAQEGLRRGGLTCRGF